MYPLVGKWILSAICPLITATIPVLYFCFSIAFQLCPGQISAIMSIGTTCITLFNPLTTILCFRCFRQVTARTLTGGRYRNDVKHMATIGIHSTSVGALSLAN
ncbi:hypothetical protein Ddc_19876 [Ditylenchus destructor]|nr:hypothetical protein Ddc_19876 [Ditylenchus destructor]